MNSVCSLGTEKGQGSSQSNGVCVRLPFPYGEISWSSNITGSFILAFSTRAGVDVLLMLIRTWRKRKLRLALIRLAIFGAVPLRFGAMIGTSPVSREKIGQADKAGTFTFLNTLTLHLLRLAPPLSYFRRRIRAGIFNKPTFGPPEREGPEGERRWQAAVAGAVGSLGLLWESKSRRTGVAQQYVFLSHRGRLTRAER